jgi:signal transduction histidine kinase
MMERFTTLSAKGGMRERIKLAGGETKLESKIWFGMKLSFWFPI